MVPNTYCQDRSASVHCGYEIYKTGVERLDNFPDFLWVVICAVSNGKSDAANRYIALLLGNIWK